MARNNTMIRVNGSRVLTPSTFDFSINDISTADSGRTQNGQMHKTRVARKRKIALSWNNVTPDEAHSILAAFRDVYFRVNYFDPDSNQTETREFYAGDMSAPIKQWSVNNKIYSQVSFDIIER